MPKQQLNIRISDLTRRQLDDLTQRWGTNQSETVSIIIDRIYQKEFETMPIETIKIEYSDIWGNTETDNIDINESEEKYQQALITALSARYPGAEIEVIGDINDHVSVNGDTAHDEVPWVNQVIENVWETWDWVVEN